MKILVVTQYFWPENFRINDLVLGLKDLGHEIHVLTGMPNYPGGRFYSGYTMFGPGRELYQGIPLTRVPLIPRGSGRGWRLAVNYLSFVVSASVLGPIRSRGPFDCIFVFEPSPITVGIPALLLKKIWKIPILFWVQDLWPESLSAAGAVHSFLILKWAERLVRFIYDGCDLLLAQSRSFVTAIEKQGVDPGKIVYYPNSAEELYQPLVLGEDAPEQALLPAGFRIMFAGNVGAAQDFATILAAAEQLKEYADIHWIIIGDGRMLPWVRGEVEKRGLNKAFHLLGRFPVERMPRFFCLADALLVTLLDQPIFSSTIPSKIQSYMACGKPIIAALAGEGAAVVREAGAGLAVPPEKAEHLAEAILSLYRMTETQRQAMGRKGRKYFLEHFERKTLLAKLNGWIEEIVTQRREKR